MLWFRRIDDARGVLPLPSSRADAAALLEQARRRDPWGHRVHFALACVYVVLLTLTTFPKDAAFVCLCLCAAVRLPATWRCYAGLLRDRGQFFLWLWVGWSVLGFLWSEDAGEAWRDVRAYRTALTGFAMWPVVGAWVWLVWAFLGGVMAQNVVQGMEAWELFGPSKWEGGRLGGWLHPIQTGTFCGVAMCLGLAGLLRTRDMPVRIALAGGVLMAGAGLIGTGSRGPWLAAAVAMVAMLLMTAMRRKELRRTSLLVGAAALATATIVAVTAWQRIEARFTETARGIERYEEGRARGDAVTRLRSWEAAWELFLRSPIAGVGTGDFPAMVGTTEAGATIEHAQHAHSSYMHVLACNGAVGFVLMVLCFGWSLVNAWREPPDSVFRDGVFFAMIAWLIAAQFDAYQQNGQMLGLFTWLAVISSSMRPVGHALVERE